MNVAGAIQAYYASNPSFTLTDWHQREFGFAFVSQNGPYMRRHQAHTPESLGKYATAHTPLGVYSSLSRYDAPAEPDMQEKTAGRSTTDILIDVDVPPGPPPRGGGTLAEAWHTAKKHTMMAEEILETDLGVARHEVSRRFSGSKGYHLLLEHEPWVHASRSVRTEVASLLTGIGASLYGLFPTMAWNYAKLPKQEPQGGLRRRMFTTWRKLQVLAKHPSPDLVGLVESVNDTMHDAAYILSCIGRGDDLEKLINAAPNMERTIMNTLRQMALPMRVDVPVLTDMSRMCRVPGSVNAKMGLQCRLIDDVQGFDPLTDAAIVEGPPVDIACKRALEVPYDGEVVRVGKAPVEVPMQVALTLAAAGLAA